MKATFFRFYKPQQTISRVIASMSAMTVSVMFVACSSDSDSLGTNINGNTISLSSSLKGLYSFQLTASGGWNIETDSDWLTFNPARDEGSAAVVMYYAANTESRQRSTTFTIVSGSKSLTYTVMQAAGSDSSGSSTKYSWLELPEVNAASDEMFVTHFATLNGNTVRNYSMLYSGDTYAATWVAYPLHKAYIGSAGRTNAWGWDPVVPTSWQTNLTNAYGSGPTRGHQIPSADRTATQELNTQTFYFTNMTPQDYNLNAEDWLDAETWMRNNIVSDTLYVVTGAIFQTVGGNETVSTIVNRKNDGKTIPVPNYYYKVALKRKGTTGFTTIGFWYAHSATGATPASAMMTVREIEQKTGINFFANISQDVQDEIETTITVSDWKF